MSNPTSTPPAIPGGDDAKKALTAADVAKLFKRQVKSAGDDGKPTTKAVALKADEVLAFRDYGTHVVAVTTDGQKFSTAAD